MFSLSPLASINLKNIFFPPSSVRQQVRVEAVMWPVLLHSWRVVGVWLAWWSPVLAATLRCRLSVWKRQRHWSIRNLPHSLFTVSPSNRSEPRATTRCHQCHHWLSGLISVCLACQINAPLTACRPRRRPQMNISYPLWSNHNSKRITERTLQLLLEILLCVCVCVFLVFFYNTSIVIILSDTWFKV